MNGVKNETRPTTADIERGIRSGTENRKLYGDLSKIAESGSKPMSSGKKKVLQELAEAINTSKKK